MKKFTARTLIGTASLAFFFGAAVMATPNEASAKVTVSKVTATSPSGKTAYVAKGKTVSITTTVTVKPNKKANKKVTYTSANKKIATVTAKGKIKGIKAGNTKITVTSKKNKKKKATIKVVVKKKAVTNVTLNAKTATLSVGAKKTLKATVKPTKNASSKIAWSTSSKKVATVTSKGVVKGIAAGTATITAKSTDGSNKKATCKVTVGVGIASVSVLDSQLVRVTLTSAKALTAKDFVVQTKSTPTGTYNRTLAVDQVSTSDNKTYDVILDGNTLFYGGYIKVSVAALNITKEKEIYVGNVPSRYDYSVTETVEYITGRVGDVYSDDDNDWSISSYTGAVGSLKYSSVSGLPAGLKSYVSKTGTSVSVRGKFSSVQNGTTATLTAVDEAGKTFTKKFIFYIGDDNTIVGTMKPHRTELSYVPYNSTTKESASGFEFYGDFIRSSGSPYDLVIAGGSGSYSYTWTGIDAFGSFTTDEDGDRYFSPKRDANGNYAAVAAGTYKPTVTIKDSNNKTLSLTCSITLVNGITVSGTVKDAAGVAVKENSVAVYASTKKNAYGASHNNSAYTKENGTYKLRLISGEDYTMYTNVNYSQNNTSVSNKFTANATKDFAIPYYCVKFTTDISGANAYSLYSSVVFYNTTNGESSYIAYDSSKDYSMYAYLKAGSYETRPFSDTSSSNVVRAYTKYQTSTGTTDPYVSYADLIGYYRLSGSFTVTGNNTITLKGTKYNYDYDY